MNYQIRIRQLEEQGHWAEQSGPADFETDGLEILPSVGDYVERSKVDQQSDGIMGRVVSRVFRYSGDDCAIKIVVASSPWDDWQSAG